MMESIFSYERRKVEWEPSPLYQSPRSYSASPSYPKTRFPSAKGTFFSGFVTLYDLFHLYLTATFFNWV
jgi:hypothetical protein